MTFSPCKQTGKFPIPPNDDLTKKMEDSTGKSEEMKLKNFLQTVVKGENGAERSEPWCQGRGVDVQECPIIQEVKMHKSDDKTKQSLFDLLFTTS